jgi:hypothetical protein
MKRFAFTFSTRARLVAVVLAACVGVTRADGRAGVVTWSDGHQQAGDISLTAGKDLRLFTGGQQVSVTLDVVKEIHFTPEKEEMWEGFYFPNAGQATQVKTGEVYPLRYLKTQLTLGNGQVLEGHLFTTVFYIENDDGAQKVVVMAKQTGTNGEKMADLLYPTAIRFDNGAASSGSAVIDLTPAGLSGLQKPIILTQPDLTLLAAQPTPGKPAWTVPTDDPSKIIFSVVAADGIHVSWPGDSSPTITDYNSNQNDPAPKFPPSDVDPMIRVAVKTGLRDMRDFYDTRTLLGSFSGGADGTDIYSLVMMKRLGKSLNGDATAFASDQTPWSLVLLHWKYDADAKKVTLLHRAMLAIGRIDVKTPEPKIFRDPELFRDITGTKSP